MGNYRPMSINKKLIKSSTTVYNRCKSRNSKSMQAKKQRGKGLFFTEKPPKADDIDNENTHYDNNKKRSHTQLDSRKQVIAFQDRVITINIKEAQHPLK